MARRPPRREPRQPRLAGIEQGLQAPPGFVERADFLSRAEEARLAEVLPTLPLQHFEFRGFSCKRRVVSYGWRYSFGDRGLRFSVTFRSMADLRQAPPRR
ncbi:MAG TPA: hypothetical protein VGS03_06875 [Candidatus Polarisedimenticolia bacterium]|nr:hypothetical protein [Candidatus Polarisedimenticolia bacterium]